MRPKTAHGVLCVLVSAALVACPLPLWAQTEKDAPTARALFDLGRQLLSSGRFAEACPKFEESLRLEPGMGTRFNLAYCWEHVGRTASAWALYLEVAAQAKALGLDERERVARSLAEELAKRLSYLVIHVTSPVPGLQVIRNTTVLGQAAWGTPAPVDPGQHIVHVSAPGKRPLAFAVNVPDRHVYHSITLPKLADLPPDSKLSARTWTALGLGTAAVAGIAVGTVLTNRVNDRRQAASRICPDYSQGCQAGEPSRQEQLLAQARSSRTQAFISFGLGGAALLASTVLLLTGPEVGAPERQSMRVMPLSNASGSLRGVSFAAAW